MEGRGYQEINSAEVVRNEALAAAPPVVTVEGSDQDTEPTHPCDVPATQTARHCVLETWAKHIGSSMALHPARREPLAVSRVAMGALVSWKPLALLANEHVPGALAQQSALLVGSDQALGANHLEDLEHLDWSLFVSSTSLNAHRLLVGL